MRFDPSIGKVKQSLTVSQFFPVILSLLGLLESDDTVICTVPVTVDYNSGGFVLS